jgi:hypothetical protein
MKTTSQIIRVSAARSRDSAPSGSSWLDAVQIRTAFGESRPGNQTEDEVPMAHQGAAATAELSDPIIIKFL